MPSAGVRMIPSLQWEAAGAGAVSRFTCPAGDPNLSPLLLDLMPARNQHQKGYEVRTRAMAAENTNG